MEEPKAKPCDHKGHYRAAGVIPLKSTTGMMLMTILYCKTCGEVMSKSIKIGGIAVPPLNLGKLRN